MKVNFHLDKHNKPQSESGMKVMYGQAKRSGYRLRWYLILGIVISPLLFIAYYIFYNQVLVTAPGIVTSYPLTITAPQSAFVEDLNVKVGFEIDEGQVLLLLKDKSLNKEVDFLHVELEKLSTNTVQSIDVLYQTAIQNTKKSLEKVEQIQNKYDQFRKKGQVSEVDYAAIVNATNALNSQLSSQEIAYVNAQRERELRNLAGPEAQQHRALTQELIVKRAQQENLVFSAPFNGRVLDIHVHQGQRVTENTPLLTVAKNITPEITAFLNPKHLKYSQLGSKAKIIFPDGKTFLATVSKPVEVVNKLPQELQSPFEGQPAFLKVILSFDTQLEKTFWIEGMEVEVRFSLLQSAP
ncbi:HlyD family secretion protein [Vibrio sp. 404]|uniref:HlyD family secretion protein n=1 Tax=Vibrio marinisediminis TaxID=2758441 RepID=A0A7W2FMU5_9VIBR|nr:HlyD family efflux transporter periplasmic adaptor subunit [Vibrio marinisediminis]MBA5760995.1 HlyD family secretion protein [Vibrio marinisediminis]